MAKALPKATMVLPTEDWERKILDSSKEAKGSIVLFIAPPSICYQLVDRKSQILIAPVKGSKVCGKVLRVATRGVQGKSQHARFRNSQKNHPLWVSKTAGQQGRCPICPKCECDINLGPKSGYVVIGPSSSSVTRAAIGERSLRVKVMWAKSGCPLSVSTTATTPSWRPTRKLSRWATS